MVGFPRLYHFLNTFDSRLQVLKPGCAVPKYSCFSPLSLSISQSVGLMFVPIHNKRWLRFTLWCGRHEC